MRQASPSDTAVQFIKGVGPARAAQLARLGIASVADLLWALPRRYEDRTRLATVNTLEPGTPATLRAHVLAKSLRRVRGGVSVFEAALGDATGVLQCRWFRQPYLARQLRVGDELIVFGRPERNGYRMQMTHPELERLESEAEESALHMGRIVPIYPLTEGVGQRWFRRIVRTALDQHAEAAADPLPAALRQRLTLPPIAWSLRQIHFPESEAMAEAARRRLVFEELFVMQARLALRRARLAKRSKPYQYQLDGPLTDALLRGLPFTLTAGQRRSLDELRQDLASSQPMMRLLQGDVGSGKTVVAALLMATAAQSGHQAALMAPTELLAEQHERTLRRYLEPLGVRMTLLAQGIKPAERAKRVAAIGQGEIDLIVGTHALLESPVVFKRLALVVIDEQHKFGVVQRGNLVRKSDAPDVLVMTATPIPRTLALSVYGDLNCSTIDELPPGRRPIRSLWLRESRRSDAYSLIRDELRQGHQVYVVYPVVEAKDGQELKAATHMAAQLQQKVFPEAAIGLLHGQMPSAEKERVMTEFRDGRLQILVSTIIVEVGLDVPNATVMLIEHAERFGLAQLHQLRGRIGRSALPSTCIVLSETRDELASKRLQAFVDTTNGFRLAETDLELRGPGELLGRHQHGWLRFRAADLVRDRELLDVARQEAFALIEHDQELAAPELQPLRDRLRKLGTHTFREKCVSPISP